MEVLVVENGLKDMKFPYLERVLDACGPDLPTLLMNTRKPQAVDGWSGLCFAKDRILRADFRDRAGVLEAIEKFTQERGRVFSGALTYLEEAVPVTQHLTEAVSLPRITLGSDVPLRNKGEMRRILQHEAKIPQPDFVVVKTYEKAKEAVEHLKLPCILKPVEMGGSLGVWEVNQDNVGNLPAMFADAQRCDFDGEDWRGQFGLSSDVIVEKLIEAPQEISVECLVFDEKLEILAVTQKFRSPRPRYFEIGHTTPIDLPPERLAEIREHLNKAVRALKLANTAIHPEFLLPEDGPAVLVELGTRLGGDFIPILVEEATGIKMVHAAVAVATGKAPDTLPKKNECAGIMFLSAEEKNRLDALSPAERPSGANVVVYEMAEEDRVGHVVLRGKDPDEVNHERARLSAMIQTV